MHQMETSLALLHFCALTVFLYQKGYLWKSEGLDGSSLCGKAEELCMYLPVRHEFTGQKHVLHLFLVDQKPVLFVSAFRRNDFCLAIFAKDASVPFSFPLLSPFHVPVVLLKSLLRCGCSRLNLGSLRLLVSELYRPWFCINIYCLKMRVNVQLFL